ncbi:MULTISPECIES: hypothetical protein [Halorubrum]|uniref:Uncharacterized protein n=1 Tax=Halorubrum ruber TaxID=2982524 RepID=A0A8T8LQ50_9EURY|nr:MULTISPECIES: hypothetical protein [Halorubrum]QUO49098.1 hypothetical protein J7656_07135 [Halorubrum ruber]
MTAIRDLRCRLFGHDWVRTLVETTDDVQRRRTTTCPRCGTATAFVDGDRDGDGVADA